ncbi:prepilin-type N-terminal cleavage/methylation domain-containing protein [uncultured Paraglaciecola sp.]|uniref:type IV pilus modification PilV family protein n=1 Tax=uncultured Paraglaciecola sp. TaxID=1765024 RepID=UPI002613D23D|nr:prepilin-type N-terminal cleavage/methylation domain-containing protein [uncultured Paraglaciecola sp.]
MENQKGFSLVEVSIASLIIMLGVTGYVTLQSEYVIADAKINLRGLALQLAQNKLADLSYFQQLSHVEGGKSYQSIETNLGGSTPAGEQQVILSSATNMQTYDTQWQVENLYFVDTNFDDVADTWVKFGAPFFPTKKGRFADLKSVKVMVTWMDTSGDSKQLDMFGYIAPVAQASSFHAKYRLPSTLAIP